jgi:hypothetical protein
VIRSPRRTWGTSIAAALAVAAVCAGAAAAVGARVPTLRLSPQTGPVGTLVHVTGTTPADRPCPFVHLTLGHGASGAANLVRSVRATRGRYAIAFRAPAVPLPTTPTTYARVLIVRVSCQPSRHEVYARDRDVAARFRLQPAPR